MNHTQKIIERLEENKSSIKQYKSYEKAVQVAESYQAHAHIFYTGEVQVAHSLQYVIVYVPTTGKYTPMFLLGNFIAANKVGGYMGFLASKGFYTA